MEISSSIIKVLEYCRDNDLFFLGKYLGRLNKSNNSEYHNLMSIIESPQSKVIKIKLLCNWCSSKELCNLWNKMSKGNGSWNSIQISSDDKCDYYVIINSPQNEYYDPDRTIVFQMEPDMKKELHKWGEWSEPKNCLKVFTHEVSFNNNEWHLSKTYKQLCEEPIIKSLNILSTVLSEKYRDSGHMKRIDFVKYLEKKGLPIHVYGTNSFKYKQYMGSLPYHNKDSAIFPYKYTFNVENKSIKNYYTEKLVDGILGECLVFYSGCWNVREYLDERAYVYLELSDFEKDYNIILKAINEDWYTQRLPYIKEAKNKILNGLQFFPRLEKIIRELKK